MTEERRSTAAAACDSDFDSGSRGGATVAAPALTAAHACSSPNLSSRAASRARDVMGWLSTLLWLTPGVALRWL